MQIQENEQVETALREAALVEWYFHVFVDIDIACLQNFRCFYFHVFFLKKILYKVVSEV